jgi:ketosteroid isomerase-like protein
MKMRPEEPSRKDAQVRIAISLAMWLALFVQGCATKADQRDPQALRDQVVATETAFAGTLADRNFGRFAEFISGEAIFFSGSDAARGKKEILERWRAYFDGPKAPFSWAPEKVEVLDSGLLALSSGPVRDAEGKRIATFSSIWRQESPGVWRIVFDKGCDVCDCEARK